MAKTSNISRHFSLLKIHCDVLIYTTTYFKLEQSYPGQSDVSKMTQAVRRIIWEIHLLVSKRKNWNAVLGHTAAEMGTSITRHQVESVPSHQTHNALTILKAIFILLICLKQNTVTHFSLFISTMLDFFLFFFETHFVYPLSTRTYVTN